MKNLSLEKNEKEIDPTRLNYEWPWKSQTRAHIINALGARHARTKKLFIYLLCN